MSLPHECECRICGAAEEHFSGEECVEHLKSKLSTSEEECAKLRGWVNEAEQAAGRLQSRLDSVSAELAATKGGPLSCEAHEWVGDDNCAYCRAEIAEARLRNVIGWRENDWPEGFDRRTAELVAELASPSLETVNRIRGVVVEKRERIPPREERCDNTPCCRPRGHEGPCSSYWIEGE